MKEFIWNIWNMMSAKKYRKVSEQSNNEYEWYKYLVWFDINSFFARFRKHSKSEDEIPF